MNRHHASANGYTLIEILVCIAIIAVLTTIIFAALAPARENARRTTCVSNLKQIGIALRMYIADYDGVDPNVGDPIPFDTLRLPPVSNISGFLEAYKADQVAYCPSDHRYDPETGRYGHNIGPSYHFWAYFVEAEGNASDIIAKTGPSFVFAVCDQHNNTVEPDQPDKKEVRLYNLLRLDGHVDVKYLRFPFDPNSSL